MEEVTAKLDALSVSQDEKIAALKKTQAEEFQTFKKKCQEEVDAQKAQGVKNVEESRQAAAAQEEALDSKQFKETEHHNAIALADFKTELQDKHDEELKKKIKEKKHSDKKELEQMNEGETLMSEVDEEILKEKQKEDRKALKKQLKKEYAAKLKELVRQKEVDFHLKLLTDRFGLKLKLLTEEEDLRLKVNRTLQDIQLKHLDQEHKILRDNLDIIQKTLEQFHDEEHGLRIQLDPVSNSIMLGKFSQGIEEMIAQKKKEIDEQKAAANAEFQEKLKKHEENVAKLNNPNAGAELSAEEKKKAFLTRKFNIEYTPPSEDGLKATLADLTKKFDEFDKEKRAMISAQKAKIEEKGAVQLKEHADAKTPLQQTHQTRLEKLVQHQKEERAKFEAALAEVTKQITDKMAKSKEDLKAKEETERQALLAPPVEEEEEVQPEVEEPDAE